MDLVVATNPLAPAGATEVKPTAATVAKRRRCRGFVVHRSEASGVHESGRVEIVNTIGDQMLADVILDRLVHNAYRLDLKGESLRKWGGINKAQPVSSTQ